METKKVLLREHKRHTARCVVSTPSVVLTGYPPVLTWPRGYPARGVTQPGYPPVLTWGGTLLGGYPTWVPLLAGYPRQVTPLAGYPPRCLPHSILGNVAKHYGIWVPPHKRHAARHVVSTPSVVLTGYPPVLTWPRGYPARGVTQPGYPPVLAWGVPCWGVPYLGTPPGRVPPAGYPPGRVPPSRVPPGRVTP